VETGGLPAYQSCQQPLLLAGELWVTIKGVALQYILYSNLRPQSKHMVVKSQAKNLQLVKGQAQFVFLYHDHYFKMPV